MAPFFYSKLKVSDFGLLNGGIEKLYFRNDQYNLGDKSANKIIPNNTASK